MPLDRLFRSKHLLYKALSNTAEEKHFLQDVMTHDAATYAQSTSRLLVPPRAEDIDKDMAGLAANALLSVIICLPPKPEADTKDPKPLGIIIAPEHQGSGYGSEAIRWSLEWAFGIAGMHAVRLTAFSFNTRAVRLYERLGFVREGVRRESIYFDHQWHDHIMFSMLEHEWAALRKE
ncbi:acyl-CoA N-acyltransferase [Canariomyces notabilis]|uniref:Acyl-CoA N-acyltransferase n=1 Tax=Canariomyces notabilis TaxID=2074819 RepID=A0AAN6THB3_9PEZI|nr:acyl-CoA N-acyltransferase [Canariomyces arenarius]